MFKIVSDCGGIVRNERVLASGDRHFRYHMIDKMGEVVEKLDGGISWWLLPAITTYQAEAFCMQYGIYWIGSDKPGGYYACTPVIKHSNSYTLVTMRWGYDI